MTMNTLILRVLVPLAIAFAIVPQSFGATLPTRFRDQPLDVDTSGNTGANANGQFRINRGPKEAQIFLGTNQRGGVGSLILVFDRPFEDGPGTDFALVTGFESWGPLATRALVQFFLGEKLQTSLIKRLGPDAVFEFEFPNDGIVANRVVITNISPDPPGINDEATMAMVNAGVSNTVRVRVN